MRLLFTLLLGVLCSTVNAQLDNQTKIVDFLGQEKFDQLQSTNPNYLKYLDTRQSVGFDILDMPAEKTSSFVVLTEVVQKNGTSKEQTVTLTVQQVVQQFQDGDFNILKCDLKFDRSQMTYYVLGTTGKVLLLYPAEYISKKLNSK